MGGIGTGGPRKAWPVKASEGVERRSSDAARSRAVSPEAGTAVVFDSFHGHEVLPSKRRRYALTLWLFHEPLGV